MRLILLHSDFELLQYVSTAADVENSLGKLSNASPLRAGLLHISVEATGQISARAESGQVLMLHTHILVWKGQQANARP